MKKLISFPLFLFSLFFKLFLIALSVVVLLWFWTFAMDIFGFARAPEPAILQSWAQNDQIVNPHVSYPIEYQKIRKVYYIHGFLARYNSNDEHIQLIKKIYPNAKVEILKWPSLNTWSLACNTADKFASRLVEELTRHSQEELDATVLIGHSLGAKIVAQTLAALGDERRVHHAVLLGAAMDSEDPILQYLGSYNSEGKPIGGTLFPIFCVCHDRDAVLDHAFRKLENANALGLYGPKKRPSCGILTHMVDFSSDQLSPAFSPLAASCLELSTSTQKTEEPFASFSPYRDVEALTVVTYTAVGSHSGVEYLRCYEEAVRENAWRL